MGDVYVGSATGGGYLDSRFKDFNIQPTLPLIDHHRDRQSIEMWPIPRKGRKKVPRGDV